ncbi:MAG: class I tRNA ligase family protein, partial [Candidatus Thermoplasmatota archaeon]|nr:class I tRNA ligase family protein [Candidatus Thermoplasmatota archaeon]
TAIFPQEHWPRGISVNGWVTIGGEKMSKSQGNFITLREALDDHGATITRLTLANAGEGLDDANWDPEFAKTAYRRVQAWYNTVTEAPEGARTGEHNDADTWMLARLADLVTEAQDAYEKAQFRTALKVGLFDAAKAWNWYQRRALGQPHQEVWQTFASTAIRLMAPIVPHLASEAWDAYGGEGLLIDAPFPALEAPEDAGEAIRAEELVQQVIDDVRDILKVTGEEPELIRIFTAPAWKHTVAETALELREEKGQPPNPGELTKAIMQIDAVKRQGGQAAKFAKDVAINMSKGQVPTTGVDETTALEAATDFIGHELGCPVEVHQAGEHGDVEDGGKAKRAEPGRPGLYVA